MPRMGDADRARSAHRPIWHFITGEYSPVGGGVADYTAQLVRALAAAGCECHVWTDGHDPEPCLESPGVIVHRVARGFGPAGLRQISSKLNRFPRPRKIIVQYVPHAFGFRAMNLAFALWTAARSRVVGDDVRIMFHEVAFPFVSRPLRHNLIAIINRLMAVLLLAGGRRFYTSTLAWVPLLERWALRRIKVAWTPIPSNIHPEADVTTAAVRRAEIVNGRGGHVIGHFGTYSPGITDLLTPALRELLNARNDFSILLIGRSSDAYRETLVEGRSDWAPRVVATGEQTSIELSATLRACDLLIQPFPDGATTRRTSLMAGLAHGVATLTTLGWATESIWKTDSIAPIVPVGDTGTLVKLAMEMLDDDERRAAVGQHGRACYVRNFSMQRTIQALLEDGAAPLPGDK